MAGLSGRGSPSVPRCELAGDSASCGDDAPLASAYNPLPAKLRLRQGFQALARRSPGAGESRRAGSPRWGSDPDTRDAPRTIELASRLADGPVGCGESGAGRERNARPFAPPRCAGRCPNLQRDALADRRFHSGGGRRRRAIVATAARRPAQGRRGAPAWQGRAPCAALSHSMSTSGFAASRTFRNASGPSWRMRIVGVLRTRQSARTGRSCPASDAARRQAHGAKGRLQARIVPVEAEDRLVGHLPEHAELIFGQAPCRAARPSSQSPRRRRRSRRYSPRRRRPRPLLREAARAAWPL